MLTFPRVLCIKFPSECVMEKEHPASEAEWLERTAPKGSRERRERRGKGGTGERRAEL